MTAFVLCVLVLQPASLRASRRLRLTDLIAIAYHVKPFQISGLPEWARERYEVDPHQNLQVLLADRFRLRVHHQTKQLSVLALVVDGPNAALLEWERRCEMGSGGGKGGRRDADRITEPMGEHIADLLFASHGPVIDETGLTGRYCELFGLDPPTELDRWGLRLEPRKRMMDILVIDRVEKP
jgi:uncharacterized protein (TIGR03435 family)